MRQRESYVLTVLRAGVFCQFDDVAQDTLTFCFFVFLVQTIC